MSTTLKWGHYMSTFDRMLAAARAVADDMDLRLAGCVNELNTVNRELDTVRGELQKTLSELGAAHDRVAELDGQVSQLTAEVAEASERADALYARITQLEAENADLRARLEVYEPPIPPRDPIVQPYSPESFLNKARRKDATLGTTSHPMAVSYRSVKGGFNRATFTTPLHTVRADTQTAPLTIQEVGTGYWRPDASDKSYVIDAPLNIQLAGDMATFPPIYNSNGTLDFGGDGSAKPDGFWALQDARSHMAVQAYKVCWSPTGPSGRTLIARRGTVKFYDLRGDVLDQRGFRASGLDGIGGLIRNGELETGINHVMYTAMTKTQSQAITSSAQGFQYPAVGRDSAGGYTGTIPLGQMFYLRPDLDIATLGLSAPGLVLARALQDYGVIHTDTAGYTVLFFEHGPVTSAHDAAKLDWQTKLLPNMVPLLDTVTPEYFATGERVCRDAPPLIALSR